MYIYRDGDISDTYIHCTCMNIKCSSKFIRLKNVLGNSKHLHKCNVSGMPDVFMRAYDQKQMYCVYIYMCVCIHDNSDVASGKMLLPLRGLSFKCEAFGKMLLAFFEVANDPGYCES